MLNKPKSTITQSSIPYILPSNWTWFHWSDLIEDYQQGLIRSNNELGDGNVYYLKMGDIDNFGRYSLNKVSTTNANDDEINDFILSEGDFLINVRNSFDLVGKTCVIENTYGKEILFNHMLVRIKHKEGIPSYYINAFLNIPSSKKLLDRCKQGTTTVIALYQRDLYKLPIAIPNEGLLNFICNLYKNFNSKIALNNRINAELEAMAKTIYDYWFVQFDFPNAEGKPYKSSGGKMVWSEELKREIPEGWKAGELSDLATTIMRGISPKYIENNGICVLNQKCIRDNTISFEPSRNHDNKQKDASTRLVKLGDILVNSTGFGTLGRVAFVKWLQEESTTVDSHVTIVRPNEKNINSEYLAYSVQYKQAEIENMAEGSTGQTELSRVKLGSLRVLIPTKELQLNFAAIVKPQIQKIANNEQENQQLSSLRDWLLPMLMNGQVMVGNAAIADAMDGMLAAERSVGYGENFGLGKSKLSSKKYTIGERTIFAAYLIKQFNFKGFGRVMLMKLLYLIEHLCELDFDSHYKVNVAGPYDDLIREIELKLRVYQLYNAEQNKLDNHVHYYEMGASATIDDLFMKCFSSEAELINQVIQKFKKSTWDQCEIIATMFAVWNNRILSNRPINDMVLKHDFLSWDPKKRKYKDRLDAALIWMREKEIEPIGWGQLVEK